MATKKDENKKAKLNNKVEKKKTTKFNDKYVSDESKEVRRFIIILFSIIILVIAVYGITKLIKKDNNESTSSEVKQGSIDYSLVSVGTMLNRNEEEYYVMIYDSKDTQAVRYSAIISGYMNKLNSLPIYYCDLSNKLNSEYYVGEDGKSNKKATDLTDLALGKLTLINVKNGKISKYIEDLDEIKSELGL